MLNVVCKECSICFLGFGVLRFCEKIKDIVCKRCFFDKDGIGIYEDIDCGRGGVEGNFRCFLWRRLCMCLVWWFVFVFESWLLVGVNFEKCFSFEGCFKNSVMRRGKF